MKKVQDFMKMNKLDVFLRNGTYKMFDENLEKQLNQYQEEMNLICEKVMKTNKCSKSQFEKFKTAHDNWYNTLVKKNDNKEEWENLKRAARRRKIDLNRIEISL